MKELGPARAGSPIPALAEAGSCGLNQGPLLVNQDWLDEQDCGGFWWATPTTNVASYGRVLRAMPDLLAWRDPLEARKPILALRRLQERRRFRSAIEFIAKGDLGLSRAIEVSVSSLSSSGRECFLSAPLTYHRIATLGDKPGEAIAALADSLNAQLLAEGAMPQQTNACWTAGGEFHFAAASAELASPERVVGGPDYCAPLMADRVVIDFESPGVESAKSLTAPAQLIEMAAGDRQQIKDALSNTLVMINSACPAAGTFIIDFIRTLAPLKVRGGGGSVSERGFPGLVALLWSDGTDVGRLASSLVHESVHQAIYILESAGRFAIMEPKGGLLSPWSGKSLDLGQFIHACFVWYALAQFWRLAIARRVFSRAVAERELAAAMMGFQNANPLDSLLSHPGALRFDVFEVASSLRECLQKGVLSMEAQQGND